MKPHPLVAWVRERAMRAPRWVFMGPNGVGKGTYASQLATLLGLVHVATGDLLRAELASGAPRAAQARTLRFKPSDSAGSSRMGLAVSRR
jgi:2-phosphoglycerate kinase